MQMPIIITHYGNVDYLGRTLLCASITNPGARRILVGDESNRSLAGACGWEHVNLGTVRSLARSEFGKAFKHVQGRQHPGVKNGGDWLRFVFERWFIVEALCNELAINRFWHFDSDVMLVEPLGQFEPELLASLDFTRQCNDTCLNGYVSLAVLSAFCEYTLALFRNAEFLNEQQMEFDGLHPGWAFTEMRAFALFSESPACIWRGAHLENRFRDWWFDDCICQEDGFAMVPICYGGRKVKDIRFSEEAFLGARNGFRVRVAALNLSWVPTGVFDWTLACVRSRSEGTALLHETSIRDSRLPLAYRWNHVWAGTRRAAMASLRKTIPRG